MNHEAAPLGAIRENKPAWQRSGVPGLYRRSNGNFYSRYCINGRRTWRSLDTDQFEAAKLRHEGDGATSRPPGRSAPRSTAICAPSGLWPVNWSAR